MRLFLDTSMLLAASGSDRGASREVFRLASVHGWTLIVTPYVIEEVERNVGDLPPGSGAAWAKLRLNLLLDDVVTVDRLAVLPVSKDRPVLFSALAWADVLLTRDTGDFTRLLGRGFYGLHVLTPGDFLMRERTAGRLKDAAK